ncbi:MAG: glycosyltransferase family 4 protein [Deltaproteobacteria bacterium]|nr:glycosyltransferase family 4 protein [Deltaproteobacteria bacterium]
MLEGSKKTDKKRLALIFGDSVNKELAGYILHLALDLGDEFEFAAVFWSTRGERNDDVAKWFAAAGITVLRVVEKKHLLLKVVKGVAAALDLQGAQAVITFCPQDDFLGYVIKKIRPRIQWIAFVRGMDAVFRLKGIKRYFYKRIIQRLPWVVFESEHDKQLMQGGVGHQRMRMIHSGGIKKIGRGDLKKMRGPEKIIFIGDIEPCHGCADLIKAYTFIKPTHPHVTVAIYGTGAQRFELVQRVASLGLSEKIRFLETPLDLQSVFSDHAIYVQPYSFQGLSFGLQAAVSLKIPVVAYDQEAIREFLTDEESALLVKAGDAYKLGHALARILNEGALGARLAKTARLQLSSRLSYSRALAEYSVFFKVVSSYV